MTITEQLQKFLKQKLDKLKLKKINFTAGSGISTTTTYQILNADLRNPDFNTILKMANYFNCSLDEVTGRDKSLATKTPNYRNLSSDEINQNLKNFINVKLQETGLTQYQLGKKLGFNSQIIYNFMQEHRHQEKLSSAVTIALADYFNVSLDEMIGRTSPATKKTQMVEKPTIPQDAIQKLGKEDMESLQQIKSSVSTNKQKLAKTSLTAPNKQQKNDKGHSR